MPHAEAKADTPLAIRMASYVADLTLMVDNSRDTDHAFTLVRAQQKKNVLYDSRDAVYKHDPEFVAIASLWLKNVAP